MILRDVPHQAGHLVPGRLGSLRPRSWHLSMWLRTTSTSREAQRPISGPWGMTSSAANRGSP